MEKYQFVVELETELTFGAAAMAAQQELQNHEALTNIKITSGGRAKDFRYAMKLNAEEVQK